MEKQSNIKIIVDKNSPSNRFVEEILQRAKNYNIQISDILNKTSKDSKEKILYISDQKGFIRPCPCSRKYRCCNYFTIDTIEGCIYDCEYCILKGFLDTSKILIKTDIDQMLLEIREFRNHISTKNLTIRMGTGELSDSLALEHIAPFAPILIEETRKEKNIILEFKTKSDNVEEILNLPHNPKTTISFSMTTPYLHKELEHNTPSPLKRISSAIRFVEHSYRVGFHFDPIIIYKGYVNDYEQIIKEISSKVPSEAISWVSLGTIRFQPVMLNIYNSPLLFGEYIFDSEKKMRYPIYTRREVYRNISDILKIYFKNKIKIYLCMETDTLNHLITGRLFKTDEELNIYIIEDIK